MFLAQVMLKLEQLFTTTEEVVPTAFIFFGNFLSETGSMDGAASSKLKGKSEGALSFPSAITLLD